MEELESYFLENTISMIEKSLRNRAQTESDKTDGAMRKH
jgi:hypothetical protein